MNFIKKLSLIALSAIAFASCDKTSKDGNTTEPAEGVVTDSTQKKETAANTKL
jgi:mercuric ion binding protein